MSTPISSLTAMSPRGRAALTKAGYKSVEEAKQATDEELLALPGFGKSSLHHLKLFNTLFSDPAGAPATTLAGGIGNPFDPGSAKKARLHAFARELYFQLSEKNGFSPTHAEKAWQGALQFEEEREKALAGEAG